MHVHMNGKNVGIQGKGVLLKKIIIKPLPMEGGSILEKNRIVGIMSNAVGVPPSDAMASIGAGLDFSKHVRRESRSVQKKKRGGDDNIKFVF